MKKVICLIAVLFLLNLNLPIYASAIIEESITNVQLHMKYTPIINDINPDGVFIDTKKADYEMTIEPKFNTTDIEIGDPLQYNVSITANEGYNFRGLKVGSCQINNGSILNLNLSQDRRVATFNILLKPLEAILEAPSHLEWDDTKASWQVVDRADQYEVRLHKINNQGKLSAPVISKVTNQPFFDFEYILYQSKGDYVFTVVATSKNSYLLHSDKVVLDYEKSNLITQEMLGITEGSWIKGINDNQKYKYNKEFLQSGIHKINGLNYYFDDEGIMATGWEQFNSSWYFFNENGSMAIGWLNLDGNYYYLNENGCMQSGWLLIDQDYYYLGTNGVRQTGWIEIDEEIFYIHPNGKMNTNTLRDKIGTIFYFNKNGKLIFYNNIV